MSDSNNQSPRDWALRYAERGWQIFPCHSVSRGRCTCGRSECESPGKHPRTSDGSRSATDSPDTVAAWWKRWPDANVGLNAGRSGLLVVDVDAKHDGFASLRDWEASHGPLPETLTAATGGGGKHLFFRQPPDETVRGSGGWLRGVDVKASDNEYVVLPPGLHISGGTYRWSGEDLAEPAPAPSSVIESLSNARAGSSTASSGSWISDAIQGLPEGRRDEGLFRAACAFRSVFEDDYEMVLGAVLHVASRCDPPFDPEAARVKVGQAFKQSDGLASGVAALKAWLGGVSGEARSVRVVCGGDFILDEPEVIPALWGEGERVLWAEGEGLMLVGHQGVGKTTIAQQVVLHRLGVRDGGLAGLPVARDDRPVLYLAMDRPRQTARSFRRMVGPEHRDLLNQRLRIWKGPPPVSPLASVDAMADWVAASAGDDVGLVVVDSVKDLAPGVSDDKVGAGLNSAWQAIIARGVDVMLLHHERKAGSDSVRSHRLDDVYGSTWLTSGLGSVIGLAGQPGDPVVELHHLKQPAEPVGPLTLRHDHATGTTLLDEGVSLADFLAQAGAAGVTAEEAARAVLGRATDADLKKIKRELAKLDKASLVERIPGQSTGHGRGREPDRWRASGQAQFVSGLDV